MDYLRAEERRRRAEARRQEAAARRRAAERRRAAAAAAKATQEKKKEQAVQETEEAQDALLQIQDTLKHTLSINDAISWNSLIEKLKLRLQEPASPERLEIPQPPSPSDRKYTPRVGFFALFSARLRQRATDEAKSLFQHDKDEWKETKRKIERLNAEQTREYERQVSLCQAEREHRKRRIEELRSLEKDHIDKDPDAIVRYCEMVLDNSEYPSVFPQQCELDYRPDSGLLIVDYLLPSTEAIPTVKQIRYVAASDEFKESLLSQSAVNKLYDDLVYQIALRTIHELYEADTVGAIKSIVFNGYVQTFNKATGHDIAACVVSVQADRKQFLSLNLGRVDAKSCFENLNGVTKGKPSNLSAITPTTATGRSDTFALDDDHTNEPMGAKEAEGF